MQSSIALLLLTALTVSGDPDDPVLQLTADNFDAAVAQNPFLMVQFYAPWCPHCQELAPVYVRTAEQLGATIRLAKVDATRERALAARNDAGRFPTLVFFRRGKPLVYRGARDQAAMVRWMTEQVTLVEEAQREEVPTVRFREGEGHVAEVETTTKGAAEKILPVLVNLLVLILVSAVLV